jgi:putative transposase
VLRDRDATYDQSFDAVFEAEDMDVLLSAPRAPRMKQMASYCASFG